MRVLALVPGDIGNQILFFPTLETIKQQYPQAIIDVLVEPRSKKAYRVCKNVDDVLVFDFQDRNSFADYLNLLGTVRDREYDALISLKTSWRIKLLLWLNGIPLRVGFADDAAMYLSQAVPRKSEQYRAEMYHDLVAGLGIKAVCPPVEIAVPTEDIRWAEAEQQRGGMENGYIVVCDEPTDDGVSSYPLASWQKIIADIEQRQTELTIVLLQTSLNQSWVTAMVTANGNLKVIAPPDVGKAAAIIAGSNLILSNSSKIIQLAVATDTYTFALIGQDKSPTLPETKTNCTPIFSSSNDIQDIKPETVIKRLWQE
ncbi:MAG: glycosyltransferase family 9 protein [Cyanobacteria bacterium J06623_7]